MSKDLSDLKVCRCCDKMKPLSDFRKNGKIVRGTCKTCDKKNRSSRRNKGKHTTEQQVSGITELNNQIEAAHLISLEANRNHQKLLANRRAIIDMHEFQNTPEIRQHVPPPPPPPPEAMPTAPNASTEPDIDIDDIDKLLDKGYISKKMMDQIQNKERALDKSVQQGEVEYKKFRALLNQGILAEDLINYEPEDDK